MTHNALLVQQTNKGFLLSFSFHGSNLSKPNDIVFFHGQIISFVDGNLLAVATNSMVTSRATVAVLLVKA